MKKHQKILLFINLLLMTAVFVGNYIYLTEGGSEVKALCSSGFALMGIVNLIYALICKSANLRYNICMSVGLLLACVGDITLNDHFILGASLFALGHICFFVSYCFVARFRKTDLIAGGILFLCTGGFVLFCPLLEFPNTLMQIVCFVYALIISLMVGKAISNFIHRRNTVTVILFVASILFCFSDLMLVFDWFMGAGRTAALFCMGTYYPAECLLALSSLVVIAEKAR